MTTNRTVQKQASKDAHEYAAAYMSYGEGAGTRRKHIEGTVGYKAEFVPGYREAFEAEHAKQNMEKHAKAAKNGHRAKAVAKTVDRNTRALATGKHENMSGGLLVLGVVAYGLHKTGLDKPVMDFTKKQYKKARSRFTKVTEDVKTTAKAKTAGDDGVFRITDVD
jgi:hypothetical protein